MELSPDEILAEQLRKLAVKATRKELGSGVVSWVATRMPTDVSQITLHFTADPESIVRTVIKILGDEGTIRNDVLHDSQHPTVSGVVGSGFLNLNPAVVTIEVLPPHDNTTTVLVFGTAKEGLIIQRAGEKAAKRIAELLKSQCG